MKILHKNPDYVQDDAVAVEAAILSCRVQGTWRVEGQNSIRIPDRVLLHLLILYLLRAPTLQARFRTQGLGFKILKGSGDLVIRGIEKVTTGISTYNPD